jgi:hypothetical protein
MAKPVQESLIVLQAAQQQINKLLSSPEHVQNLLEINSNFRRIATRLQYLGAVLEPPTNAKKTSQEKFPPITNFMGEEIKLDKAVTKQDINPDDVEKKNFVAKVDKLWKEIGGMSIDIVLNSFTIPIDVLVVRGVAKRAGVKDFDRRAMDTEFIADIMMGVEIKNEENEGLKNIQDNSQTGQMQTLTKEDIAADPELQKLKAEPGDTLVVDNGKKKIQKLTSA